MVSADHLRELLHYDPLTGVFVWRVSRGKARIGKVAGTPSHGYINIGINGWPYGAHRLAWLYVHGEWPAGDLDHKDSDRSNNRIDNLRLATRSQNAANTGPWKNNSSGFKGVRLDKYHRRWAAGICVDGRRVHLGTFDTAEQAHAAYTAALQAAHGEFARAA